MWKLGRARAFTGRGVSAQGHAAGYPGGIAESRAIEGEGKSGRAVLLGAWLGQGKGQLDKPCNGLKAEGLIRTDRTVTNRTS